MDDSINRVVSALIEASISKPESVSFAIGNSLHSLGKRHPNQVAESLLMQLRDETSSKHKLCAMKCIERICGDRLEQLQHDLVVQVIRHCVSDIAKDNEPPTECHRISCNILTEIGAKHCHDVVDTLFAVFQPGSTPNVNTLILKTLADLSVKNPFEMVPYLKATLGSLVPMMATVRQDNVKSTFAYALMQFAEAIQEYLANIEKAPDRDVNVGYFSSEFESAFNQLFLWLQTRDSYVRACVIESLGVVIAMISKQKLEDSIPKLIPALLSSYKRQSLSSLTMSEIDGHSITKSLCLVLEVAIKEQLHVLLEVQLNNILANLFNQISSVPDFSQQQSIRNNNEILRCFATLTVKFCDPIVLFLLHKLESNNETIRVGSLTILKHLINACDAQLVSKMPTIFFGLKMILQDDNIRVRKMLAQVIVAVAYHGYLDLSGGQVMIQFIIKQCSLPSNYTTNKSLPKDIDENSEESLRLMCENILHLLVTTVVDIENVMWPHLFEFLLPVEYVLGIPVICRAIVSLMVKIKQNDNDKNNMTIDFDRHPTVPKPPALMARLLVLIGCDSQDAFCLSILKLARLLAPMFNENLLKTESPLSSLDKLVLEAQLGQNENDIEKWQSSVLNFITDYIEAMDQVNNFTDSFGKSLLKQIHLYNHNSTHKYFYFLVLGFITKKIGTKKFASESIDVVFANCNHLVEIERKGCAHVVGQAASGFLDVVLVKLEQIVEQAKGSGFLNMIVDTLRTGALKEQEHVKASVLISYGFIAKNAASSLLMTRLETPILRSLVSYYKSSKEPVVKVSFIQAVHLISESILLENLKEPYVLKSRNDLLVEIIGILKSSPLTNTLQIGLCLDAISALILLEPIISDKTKVIVLEVSSSAALTLQNCEEVMDSYKSLLRNVFGREKADPDILEGIVRIVNKWMSSPNPWERFNAVDSIYVLLQNYYNSIEASSSFKNFNSFGFLAGLFIPRCFDPLLATRRQTFNCLNSLCLIIDKIKNRISGGENLIAVIFHLMNECDTEDPEKLFGISDELTKCIVQRFQVNDPQILFFFNSLVDGLTDSQSSSSIGSSLVLDGLIKTKAAEMKPNVEYFVTQLHKKFAEISNDQTKRGSLKAFCTMIFYHLPLVVKTILTHDIPLDEVDKIFLKTAAQDETTGKMLLEFLLEILTENAFPEKDEDDNQRKNSFVVLQSFAAVCALKEVILATDKSNLTDFGRIFTTLLISVVSNINVDKKLYRRESKSGKQLFTDKTNPVLCSIETFQTFLSRTEHNHILTELSSQNWADLANEPSFADSICLIAKSLADHSSKHIPIIINRLSAIINSEVVEHRVVSVAIFSEFFVRQCINDEILNELVLNNLLNMLVDSSSAVRRLCIRGLGTFGEVWSKPTSKFTISVISALLNEIEKNEEVEYDNETALEAITGLSNILSVVDADTVKDYLLKIALCLRTQFDKEDASIRNSSFAAFGKLTKFESLTKHLLIEQMQGSFISLLLYLNDNDADISSTCQSTLKSIAPLLDCPKTNELIQKHLKRNGRLHYGEFANAIAKSMITDMPDRIPYHCNNLILYLKLERPIIQSAACMLLGAFFDSKSGEEQEMKPIKDQATSLLVFLLKSPYLDVCVRAADALSLL